ncbi:helix-turn-helix domain-containing protein [Gulosibacter bifidus]|uniref:Helix-turn-helix domain-containing protein n=1 Tax=Gulosibacter bifidus TaxID=272239 RepID=A0ABW5RIT9_9MICO|nr:helix-turn-helix transcriptional regulator [Gulosibacter bifidus]
MTMQPMTGGAIPAITLRTRLRVAREFAELEQGELAERAGISRATISNAERGLAKPNRATLAMWAFACGVDADWLRTGETNNAPSPGGDGADAARPKGLEPLTF